MPIKVSSQTKADKVNLADYAIPAGEAAWLKKKLGATFSFDELDHLAMAQNLTADEKKIVEGMRRSVLGNTRADQGVVASKDGDAPLSTVVAMTLEKARLPTGELAEQQKLRADMLPALVGHESELESFVQMLKDFRSPARRFPPLMALVGDPAHGKDQAITGYARSVFSLQATVHTVNLKGGDPFAPGGPLSLPVLQALEKSGGVVRVQGAEGLRASAPAVAAKLGELLTAVKGDPNYVRLNYIFDFDAAPGTNGRQLMVEALDWVGNANLSALASFKHLDGPSMVEYAKRVLPDLLAGDTLGKLKVEFDDQALALLGEALATPHKPLAELEARLLRFVMSKFDTQTSVDRAGGVLRVSVEPKFALDNVVRNERLAALHQPLPDLFSGAELFIIYEVAKQKAPTAERDLLLKHAGVVVDRLSKLDVELTAVAGDKGPEAGVGALAEALVTLRQAITTALKYATQSHRLNLERLVPDRELQPLQRSLAAAEAAFAGVDAKKLGARNQRWVKAQAEAKALIDAARLFAAGLSADLKS
ncbi:MAG: hypothetical protein HY903_03130 [Deltaproteobacteria bacterium]|nr:hypothetical protein [Deltaproteobacteria bacterium]